MRTDPRNTVQLGELVAAAFDVFSTTGGNQIAHGLNALANAVKVTLGPRGRNVLLEKSWGAPTITNARDQAELMGFVNEDLDCVAAAHLDLASFSEIPSAMRQRLEVLSRNGGVS